MIKINTGIVINVNKVNFQSMINSMTNEPIKVKTEGNKLGSFVK